MKRVTNTYRWCMLLWVGLMAGGALAETSPTAQPHIDLTSVTMDGQKLVQVTVTLDGKPVVGARISFLVKRTFGDLQFGSDQTYDDGTSYTPFPSDMPGDAQGRLHLIARIEAPAQYKGVSTDTIVAGGIPRPAESTSFPRVLWAPQAPISLLLSIVIVMAVVWLTFVYVVVQLFLIHQGGSK